MNWFLPLADMSDAQGVEWLQVGDDIQRTVFCHADMPKVYACLLPHNCIGQHYVTTVMSAEQNWFQPYADLSESSPADDVDIISSEVASVAELRMVVSPGHCERRCLSTVQGLDIQKCPMLHRSLS